MVTIWTFICHSFSHLLFNLPSVSVCECVFFTFYPRPSIYCTYCYLIRSFYIRKVQAFVHHTKLAIFGAVAFGYLSRFWFQFSCCFGWPFLVVTSAGLRIWRPWVKQDLEAPKYGKSPSNLSLFTKKRSPDQFAGLKIRSIRRSSESFEGPKRCESLGGHRKFTMTILTLVVAVGFVEAFLIDHWLSAGVHLYWYIRTHSKC